MQCVCLESGKIVNRYGFSVGTLCVVSTHAFLIYISSLSQFHFGLHGTVRVFLIAQVLFIRGIVPLITWSHSHCMAVTVVALPWLQPFYIWWQCLVYGMQVTYTILVWNITRYNLLQLMSSTGSPLRGGCTALRKVQGGTICSKRLIPNVDPWGRKNKLTCSFFIFH